MLETKHEEVHLSVVTVIEVNLVVSTQPATASFYCYFVGPQKSAHLLVRHGGPRSKKAFYYIYYVCISFSVCIVMQHLI